MVMVMMLATTVMMVSMMVEGDDGVEDDVGGLFWAGTSTVPEEETGGRELEARRNLSGHREIDPDENHELSCG